MATRHLIQADSAPGTLAGAVAGAADLVTAKVERHSRKRPSVSQEEMLAAEIRYHAWPRWLIGDRRSGRYDLSWCWCTPAWAVPLIAHVAAKRAGGAADCPRRPTD